MAFEIAKRCDCPQEFQLRRILYGDTVADNIPSGALDAIRLGAQRYRSHRDLQGRRGL